MGVSIWCIKQHGIYNKDDGTSELPDTEPYVRWCERTGNLSDAQISLLLDSSEEVFSGGGKRLAFRGAMQIPRIRLRNTGLNPGLPRLPDSLMLQKSAKDGAGAEAAEAGRHIGDGSDGGALFPLRTQAGLHG